MGMKVLLAQFVTQLETFAHVGYGDKLVVATKVALATLVDDDPMIDPQDAYGL